MPTRHNLIRAVLVDLDGTLVDTASEIGRALNLTLVDFGIAALEQSEVTSLIGRGVHALVERALEQRGVVGLNTASVIERFHEHYRETIATDSRLYAGAREGIEGLRAAGRVLAVVTNKPRYYSERLLTYLNVDSLFEVLVGGDDGIARKPAADMLIAACRTLGVAPAQTLMIGDSDNDVLAARAAGCPVWCVPYGYNEGRPVEELKCDRIVSSIEEAARILAGFPPSRE